MTEVYRKPTLFIQSNKKQYLGARISEYSFRRLSKHNDKFDVKIMCVEDWPQLYARDGHRYLRQGDWVQWSKSDLQSFTLTRFLPPQIMNFEGRAVVVDPDVFALTDIWQLFELDMKGRAIAARKVEASEKREAYFASSVMLLDCARLTHWKWNEMVERIFEGKLDYRELMSLRTEDPDSILVLDESWNHYDKLKNDTKLLHNTGRLTQPWKTGLPIDFQWDLKDTLPPDAGFLKTVFFRFRRWKLNASQPKRYLKHPDPEQEKFFLRLVREAIRDGFLLESDIRTEVEQRNVRQDLMDLLYSVNPS